jgi:uncharacterized protein (DUF433 family)
MQMVSHIVIKDEQARIEGKEHLKAEMVARMYIDGAATIEEVIAHYGLTAAEVHAAITYYYDNQAELDSAYEGVLTEIRENAMTIEKFKAKIAARDKRAE